MTMQEKGQRTKQIVLWAIRSLVFWVLLAYILGAVLAIRVLDNQKATTRTEVKVAKDEAQARSEKVSKIDGDHAACIVSIGSIRRYDKVVTAYNTLLETQIENIKAAIAVTPPGPLLDVRKKALANLQLGVDALPRQANHTVKFCKEQRRLALDLLDKPPAERPN